MRPKATIRVLDPTAQGPLECDPPAPPIASLKGKVLGIRCDDTWRSFTRFSKVLRQEALRQWKVDEVVLLDPGTRTGTSDEERRKIAGFVRAVDAAVVGLGT